MYSTLESKNGTYAYQNTANLNKTATRNADDQQLKYNTISMKRNERNIDNIVLYYIRVTLAVQLTINFVIKKVQVYT